MTGQRASKFLVQQHAAEHERNLGEEDHQTKRSEIGPVEDKSTDRINTAVAQALLDFPPQ